jgi:hypothetical protein
MITILDSIIIVVGEIVWPLNEDENLHFDDAQDIRMNSKNYEENEYNLDLNLLIVL